jgi:hypothetical protein
MLNLLFIAINGILNFNLNKFLLSYILPYITIFQLVNSFILFIYLLFLFINFINKKYSKTQKINFFKSLLKRMLMGFILTLLIYLLSKTIYCNNSINTYISTNILDTQLKKEIALLSLCIITSYGIYKVGSIYYSNVINQKDMYIKKKNELANIESSNKSISKNYEQSLKNYELDLINYENKLVEYKKTQLEFDNFPRLKNEYDKKLHVYNVNLEKNQILSEIHLKILKKIKSFESFRNPNLEKNSNIFKSLFITNNLIDDVKKDDIIDGNIIHHKINRGLEEKKIFQSDIPYSQLKNDSLKDDIIALSNKVNSNEFINVPVLGEESMNNSFINIVSRPSVSLISSEDLNDLGVLDDVTTLSKKSISNISDGYINSKFISCETVLMSANLKNKFSINITTVSNHSVAIEKEFNVVKKTYNQLCSNVNEILNFSGNKNSISYNNLISRNMDLITLHNTAWTKLIGSVSEYKKYVNSIKSGDLILPEVLISLNPADLIKPIIPIKPLEPVYLKLEYKSLNDIPIIDFSESYFNGLKFACINLGYLTIYPTFFFLDLFLGVGNPIPKDLFYKSLAYWIKLKIFYGK